LWRAGYFEVKPTPTNALIRVGRILVRTGNMDMAWHAFVIV
jgi:hypothetical protein